MKPSGWGPLLMRNDRGFTLLEVLAALVVLGFLVLALNAGTRFGTLAWHAQASDLQLRGDLDPVDRTLRHLVEAMDPGSTIDLPAIHGTVHTLGFTTDMPLAGGPPTRADVALLVDASHRLVVRWSPHLHVNRFGPPAPPQQTVLLDRVQQIDFSYWAAGPEGNGWLDRWNRPLPPALLRIHLAFTEADRRHWPDLVAAPMRAQRDE